MSSMSLAGMRVLVTGGAGAVGLATARQMREHGAQVMLTERNAEVLAGAQAEGFACHAADLARAGDVAGLFAEADRVLGGLDILVGCAGIGSDPLMAFADESWRDVIESNLVGHVACTRAASANPARHGAQVVRLPIRAGWTDHPWPDAQERASSFAKSTVST